LKVSDSASALKSIRSRVAHMSMQAKSAHVGSALSCIEIVFSLFQAKVNQAPPIEKVILSKGHAAMSLYANAEHFGWISGAALDRYLTDGSEVWGHPSRSGGHRFIDWSTGSLGHGLAAGTGFAYSRARLKTPGEGLVSVVLSDGECDEGSVWESVLFAGHHRLANLVAVVDYNQIQSFGRCEEVLTLEPLVDKWRSFRWNVTEVDGHDVIAMQKALKLAHTQSTSPTCLVAHTIKGKGIVDIENTLQSHYKPITAEQIATFLGGKHA
jgi:transketolase